jgi:peptidoglycan-associated lipoprotein
MKLKLLSVLTGTVLLAACSSNQDGSKMAEANAIPGSIEDFNRNVNNRAHFALDKAHLEAEAQNNMQSVAEWTRKYPQPSMTVEGHCDERGTREYNLALGQKRAENAKRYLSSKQAGVQQINTVSYGKDRLPAGPGNHDQNRVAIANIGAQ